MTPAREIDWYPSPRPSRRVGLWLAWAVVSLWWFPLLGAVPGADIQGVASESRGALREFWQFFIDYPIRAGFILAALVLIFGKWHRHRRNGSG